MNGKQNFILWIVIVILKHDFMFIHAAHMRLWRQWNAINIWFQAKRILVPLLFNEEKINVHFSFRRKFWRQSNTKKHWFVEYEYNDYFKLECE